VSGFAQHLRPSLYVQSEFPLVEDVKVEVLRPEAGVTRLEGREERVRRMGRGGDREHTIDNVREEDVVQGGAERGRGHLNGKKQEQRLSLSLTKQRESTYGHYTIATERASERERAREGDKERGEKITIAIAREREREIKRMRVIARERNKEREKENESDR